MLWPGSNLANLSTWSRKRTCERASFEAVRSEGKEVFPLPFLAPCSRVSFRVPLAWDFSRYLLTGELTCRPEMLRFSTLWEVTASSWWLSEFQVCPSQSKDICQVMCSHCRNLTSKACPVVGNCSFWILNFYHFRNENLWHKAQAYKRKIWYLKTAPLENTNQRDVSL